MTSTMTKPACPSRLELSAFEAAGRAGALAGHVAGCARCGGVLAEIEAGRAELFGGHDEAASRAAARRILASVAERRAAGRRRFWLWGPVALAPVAAAFVLLAAAPEILRGPAAPGPAGEATAGGAPAVRAKGGLAFEVYAKRGDRVFRVEDGADLLAGDRLRFAYTKPAAGHLMVFGVDDRGELFPYYEDGKLVSIAVAAGAQVMLPGSVELDAHKGWERVFAVWSEAAPDATAVRAAVREALAGAGGDLRKVTRLGLGPEIEQASVLLRRP